MGKDKEMPNISIVNNSPMPAKGGLHEVIWNLPLCMIGVTVQDGAR